MRTVLIVDDELGVAEVLSDLLSDEGFHVLTAHNGRDGLTRIEERKPDVILLDYMMPVMDGREMLLALRADARHQDIPVVMMSAFPRSSLPEDCTPTTFMRKPFDLDALLAELERLCARA